MDWKKFGMKLLCPPVWLMAILVPLCAAALVAVFMLKWDTAPIAYTVYVLSFYTVMTLTVWCIRVVPPAYRTLKQKIHENPFGNRYLTDAAFRTHVMLYLSLGINLLYVGANVLSGVLYHSAWFAVLAGYYTILAVMRFLLARFVGKNGIGRDLAAECRRARLCGGILMTINLTLSGAVLMMLYQNRGYEYSGILIYVMAMYTFYVTTHSIVDLVKYRKYNSPVLSVSKVVSLSAALVSMLSLETAMLTQFGAGESPQFRRIMIAATGAGVSAVVITLSVYTIMRANREIKKLKQL